MGKVVGTLKPLDRDGFLKLVRRTIQDKLTGHRPSIDVVSQALHMGWYLARCLQDSGSSFQRVVDEARHQKVRYYLSNSALELTETAYLLGFEDPNCFGGAFSNWEGMPPSDWRETHRPNKGDVIRPRWNAIGAALLTGNALLGVID